jgi:hypothetical protein
MTRVPSLSFHPLTLWAAGEFLMAQVTQFPRQVENAPGALLGGGVGRFGGRLALPRTRRVLTRPRSILTRTRRASEREKEHCIPAGTARTTMRSLSWPRCHFSNPFITAHARTHAPGHSSAISHPGQITLSACLNRNKFLIVVLEKNRN